PPLLAPPSPYPTLPSPRAVTTLGGSPSSPATHRPPCTTTMETSTWFAVPLRLRWVITPSRQPCPADRADTGRRRSPLASSHLLGRSPQQPPWPFGTLTLSAAPLPP